MIRYPLSKILVPVDFSEPSLYAWRYAKSLARRVGVCTVEVIYVSKFFESPRGLIHFKLKDWERARIQSRLRKWFRGADELHIAEGDTLPGILKTAEQRGADLLVMCTKGLTGLERLKRGSVTEQVVRKSKVPVLSLHWPGAQGR